MSNPLPVSGDAPLRSRSEFDFRLPTEPDGLAPVEPPSEVLEPPVPVNCPKCEWRLIDPETMGYCPKCGYFRYAEEARREVVLPKPPGKVRQLISAVTGLITEMPGWVGILLAGSFSVMLYCKALDGFLAEESRERAVVGLFLIMAGLLVSVVCQFWALLKIAPRQQELTPGDLVMRPGLLWKTAVREMPSTRWPIWFAAWGLALALGTMIFVGGQGYWFPSTPPPGPGWWE